MRTIRSASSGVFVVVLVVACRPAQHPRDDALVQRVEDGLARKFSACGVEPAKIERWRKRFVERGPRLRPDYADAYVQCVDAEACPVVLDDDAREKACARAVPAPTAKARRFCELAVERDRKCFGSTMTMDACFAKYAGFTDDAQDDGVACIDRPCSNYANCVFEVLGVERKI